MLQHKPLLHQICHVNKLFLKNIQFHIDYFFGVNLSYIGYFLLVVDIMIENYNLKKLSKGLLSI